MPDINTEQHPADVVYDIGDGDVVTFPDGQTVTVEGDLGYDETGGVFFGWTDPATGESFWNYASELAWTS
jgi:hypothetical protein